MAHWFHVVLLYFWVAPHVLLAIVMVAMWRRRLFRTYPIFFCYTVYEILEFLLLFGLVTLAPTERNLYRDAFIVTWLGSTALRFGIIQEIFNNVFQNYSRLERLASVCMRWVMVALVLIAVVTFALSSAPALESVMKAVDLLDRSVTVIQVGLLLFLFFFSRTFGLSWRSFTFGIALGFGIWAAADLAMSGLHLAGFIKTLSSVSNLVPTVSYHITVLVWIAYLLAAEDSIPSGPFVPPNLDHWNRQLEQSQ